VYLSQRFCRAVAGAVPAIFAVLASVAAVGAMGTTSPSDAAAPATTLFGSAVYREPRTEPWPHAVAREDGLFGPLKVLRVFFGGAPKPWTAPELAQRRPIVVSFKLPPREVLAGTHDAAMRRWFATAPRDHPVWWIYWHEPEDDIARNDFTAPDYRAAFTRLDALADQASNPMLRTTQVLMDWTLAPGSHRNWRTYYPGADVIDVQAWDQYGYVKARTCAYETMQEHETRRPAYQVTRAEGNDYAIAEIGSAKCIPQRPAWLRLIGTWSRGRAAFVTYYHAVGPKGADFRLTDPPSQRAWRSVVNGLPAH
jgi:hypothetical protein